MFENDIAINRFQLGFFDKVVADLPEAELFQAAPGHGHPPVWILGHLAVTAQMGESLLGGSVSSPQWIERFGPGSSDAVALDESLTKSSLNAAVVESYAMLQSAAAEATASQVAQRHQFDLFRGTPIETVGHVISLLLTNHFGFHLAQLSSCRRSAGFTPLF
ncbi:MAG: DinB family protein [Planctomycetota bacterium]